MFRTFSIEDEEKKCWWCKWRKNALFCYCQKKKYLTISHSRWRLLFLSCQKGMIQAWNGVKFRALTIGIGNLKHKGIATTHHLAFTFLSKEKTSQQQLVIPLAKCWVSMGVNNCYTIKVYEGPWLWFNWWFELGRGGNGSGLSRVITNFLSDLTQPNFFNYFYR